MKINSIKNLKFQNNTYFKKNESSFPELSGIKDKDFRDAYISVVSRTNSDAVHTNPFLATVNKLRNLLKDSFASEVYHEFEDVKAAMENFNEVA